MSCGPCTDVSGPGSGWIRGTVIGLTPLTVQLVGQDTATGVAIIAAGLTPAVADRVLLAEIAPRQHALLAILVRP